MTKRCFACMQSLVIQDKLTCSHCGYNNAEEIILDKRFLHPELTLKNRYFLGLPIESNGESIQYVGYDTINSQKIRICEFYPNAICKRNGNNVIANQDFELQFKGLINDFSELSKQLMGIEKPGALITPYDIIADNGTVYAVYDYIEGVSLNKYLRENPMEITWDDVEESFMALLYSIKTLNANNIIHRGISLDTILVTRNFDFKLKGICTSAVRAINSEIEAEIFTGYTAPEQYQKCSSHGEWTDVYGVSAVLYRILTGNPPQSADVRNPNMQITDPLSFNSKIPDTVSGALVTGLEYHKDNRTESIKNFITDLYAQKVDVSSTQIIDTRKIEMQMRQPIPPDGQNDPNWQQNPNAQNQQPNHPNPQNNPNNPNQQYPNNSNQSTNPNPPHNPNESANGKGNKKVRKVKEKRGFRIPVWFIVIVITLPAMLWGFGQIYEQTLGFNPITDIIEALLEDEVIEELPEETVVPPVVEEPLVEEEPKVEEDIPAATTEMCVVEDFRGKYYEFVTDTPAYTNMFTFTKREVFNDSAPIDQIVEQSITPNEIVAIGKEIELIVSKGKKLVLVPSITDEFGTPIHINTYENALNNVGIAYTIQLVDSLYAPSSYVDSTSVTPGSTLNREVDSAITVYVAR